ncbi:hypothetical protein EAF00_005864 [Botryotinia globosa]|nr:hypothetical protein EAF00_005864 [Botryotinia globosa]
MGSTINTLGKISLEEAYEIPNLADQSRDQAAMYIAPKDLDCYMRQIKSITGERVKVSDASGIGYTIVSLAIPGIQGITDPTKAEKHATECNNYIANEIKDHRDRLGAFACLSMHNSEQAAAELERCVKDFGFHGALVNDFQHAGPEGETYLYYDQPAYDVFWKKCVELDVPHYIHPATQTGSMYEKQFAQRKYLIGPPLSFTNADVEKRLAEKNGDIPWKKTIVDYFKTNIWVTTSGHFSTPTLKYVCEYLGPERLLFSVDYPYETIENRCGWWDRDAENIKKALGGRKAYEDVGRENAKKLLRLGKYHDSEAVVE